MNTARAVSVAPVPSDTERDLQMAGQLQRMLLPRSPLIANGWEAAHYFQAAGAVSGDYLDLVPHKDRLFFMLGDVSGKGIVASLLMAQLHAMFRALIPFDLSMEELMRRASALLCASSLPTQYATMVFGYLEPDGHTVIANAGHPPPLVIRAGRHTTVRATGLPLGMFCESRFSTTDLDLAAGDTLLLYTDGLTEAENGRGEDYDAVRVEGTAQAWANATVTELVDAVVAEQAAFRGPVRNTDDVSVMALRKTQIALRIDDVGPSAVSVGETSYAEPCP